MLAKWSPPGIIAQIDIAYGKYWWKHRKSKLAALGGVTLVGAQAWIGISDHEPASNRNDSVQVASVEIGTPTSVFGEEAAIGKNAIRGAFNVMTMHHMFDDNRRLTDVADWLSEDRGYYIPVERLVALNKDSKLIQRDADGTFKDQMPIDWTKGAVVRFKVPGPIYGGYDVVDEENESLKTFADTTKVPLATLRDWNPGLAKYDDGETLPQGTLVQIDETIDKRLVLRKLTNDDGGSLRDILRKYDKLEHDIIMANGPIIGDGKHAPDSPGDIGYFPLTGSEKKKNKQHYTAAQINAAFSPAGAPIDVSGSQVSGKKNPPPTRPKNPQKPKVVPKKPAPAEDSKGREHISINTDVFKGKHAKEQAAIAQTIVDTAYSLNIPAKDKYRAAVIGLITARVESDFINMKDGDASSVGVFQQQSWWGTYAERHNVQWATNAFYNGGSKADGYSEPGLLDLKGWQGMSYGDAAQKVQKSAYPDRYATHVSEAKEILRG